MLATVLTTVNDVSEVSQSFQSEATTLMFKFGVLILILIFIRHFLKWLDQRPKKELKTRHSLKGMRQNAIKQKIEATLVEDVKPTKRHKVELLCIQSGVDITYGEFMLICFISAIAGPVLTFIFLKNFLLALCMVVIGYCLPTQVLSLIRNRRIGILERQVESFMELFCERYKLTQSPSISLEDTARDFRGQQPIYSEITQSISELNTGAPIIEVMEHMAHRVENKYLTRMVINLKMAEDIGTNDAREMLLDKALEQYRANKSLKIKLQERIAGPKRESMILMVAVPGVMIYQASVSEDYVDFMLHTLTGQIGMTVIIIVSMLCLWFINKKIGAPLT